MEELLDWVWLRHHNILSWYVRPLFILPYCYFAYQRSLSGLILTLLLLPTTLFWFPAPDNPSEQVIKYLAWEFDFLVNGVVWQQVSLVVAVVVFLWLLALTFWKRSVALGLVVLNTGTLCKVIWSIFFGGEIGQAAILPSIVTLGICNIAVYFIWKRKFA